MAAGGLGFGGLAQGRPVIRPWRYTAADYRAAVNAVAEGPALTGQPAATPRDPALAVALAERGDRVEEETVLDDLLTDLGTGSH
ncbi:DUF2399 domain-containing protein [Streptomyces sp. NPDC008086]|uniref:DUF2399 domain-containing protein n=1 Tax=Streptomyces sp. NPDC008086 TaxID=3364807 RepID=UPI0036EAD81B